MDAMGRGHLVSLLDLESHELLHLIERAATFGTGRVGPAGELRGKVVGLLFERTSTRTRSAFFVGALKLGAQVVSYGPHDLQLNTGESFEDTLAVLSGFLDGLVARTCRPNETLRRLTSGLEIPFVNAMSEEEHP